MQVGGSFVDAQEARTSHSSPVLPILPRIARTPKVDLTSILWPLERAARTPRGRSAGRTVITGVFVAVLVMFAGLNLRGSSDDVSLTPAITHALTASVHGHRGLGGMAGPRQLAVLPVARSSATTPPSASPRSPAGSLSRR